MPVIARSVLLPYPADCVFSVVHDVASYPDFVPGCAGVTLAEVGVDEHLEAKVDIKARGFSESFTTRNETRVDGDSTALLMHLVEGPFSSFEGSWRVTDIGAGTGSRVELNVEFEFASALARLVGFSFGGVVEKLADRIVEAFCERIRLRCGG
ncbi:MAG: type II toxin-antitoxin system RatA family toxin [Pseudomonadaceae bacterium]|nr:type II toxin-antitoxin system RatA family toxin [Pseudomonadaceae bacterium]